MDQILFPIYNLILGQFSFEGWNGEEIKNPSVDFARQYTERSEVETLSLEKENQPEPAAKEREVSRWWRGLETLPPSKGKDEDIRQWLRANEAVDALLVRAKVSTQAVQHLRMLMMHICSGLNAWAAHGNKETAHDYIAGLSSVVKDFELLASHKPDLFREITRQATGIPGIISPNTETTKANAEMVKRLEVALDHVYCLPTGGKKGKTLSISKTPSNLWADRLNDHIRRARFALTSEGRPLIAAPQMPDRSWFRSAALLLPLSKDTHKAWAGVAWEVIMEATDGKPERQSEMFALQSLRPLKGRVSKRSGKKLATTPVDYRNAIKAAIFKGFKSLVGAKK